MAFVNYDITVYTKTVFGGELLRNLVTPLVNNFDYIPTIMEEGPFKGKLQTRMFFDLEENGISAVFLVIQTHKDVVDFTVNTHTPSPQLPEPE